MLSRHYERANREGLMNRPEPYAEGIAPREIFDGMPHPLSESTYREGIHT